MKALIVGDTWLGQSLVQFENSFIELKDSNACCDLFICNLEASFKTVSPRRGRRALLHTEFSLIEHLKIGKQNVLILGNNHVSDYGDEGVRRTIQECRDSGFIVVGAGFDLKDACSPAIVEIEGRTIAIFSYADTAPWVGAVAATNRVAGVAPLDPVLVEDNINKVINDVDDIWLFLHWGREFIRAPHPEQKKLAKRFVAAGATLIVGHHQHVALGYEEIDQVPVYYGLGNFIFPNIPLQDDAVLRWGRVERFAVEVVGRIENENWGFLAQPLSLNCEGLPTRITAKFRFEFLCFLTRLSSSLVVYQMWCFREQIRKIAGKIVNPKETLNSILWRLKSNGVL